MNWQNIIKNEPTILVEGLKNILDEALDEISDEEGVVYQGNKRIKHNDGSIKIMLHVESTPPIQITRVYFTHKTGINFHIEINKLDNAKKWEHGFVGDRNESISEEMQRKILAVADKIPLHQLK